MRVVLRLPNTKAWSFRAVAIGSLLLGSALPACGPDLGTCNETYAKQVVYAGNGTPYYAGQALVTQSCAGGLCHAAGAVGMARNGAPHGLNFDVDPLTMQSTPANATVLSDGIAQVRDSSDDMWGEIDDGSMPPGKVGAARPAQTWKLANGADANLPGIQTAEGKATVRNWLACGAPLVAGVTGATQASTLGDVLPPSMAMQTGSGFQPVYDAVLSTGCPTCHTAGGLFSALDLSSASKAYAGLVSKPAATGAGAMCTGMGTLVVPGNCNMSLLYLKLKAQPPCGAQMPLGGMPLSQAQLDTLCNWIMAGAMQ